MIAVVRDPFTGNEVLQTTEQGVNGVETSDTRKNAIMVLIIATMRLFCKKALSPEVEQDAALEVYETLGTNPAPEDITSVSQTKAARVSDSDSNIASTVETQSF